MRVHDSPSVGAAQAPTPGSSPKIYDMRPEGRGSALMSEPGTITDEGVARLRARIGVAEPHPQPPHYLRPGADAFRHVAMAYGDDNPLWCDPSYGAGTR